MQAPDNRQRVMRIRAGGCSWSRYSMLTGQARLQERLLPR